MNTKTDESFWMRDILESFDDDRVRMDEWLKHATKKEIFRRYCEWNGIIGYSDTLWAAVMQISNLKAGNSNV